MNRKKKIGPSRLLLHLIFILLCLICVIPLLLVVGISFTDETSLMVDGYHFIPRVFSADAYKYVFSGAGSVLQAYVVTIAVTVLGTGLHLLVTSMLAYSLTREEVTAREKISLFVYIPVLFNGGLVPYYMLMTRFLHLKNTIWVLILASLVSAVNVLIMKNFFRTIPNSLIESARIDGSGEIRTFFTIVLPLSTPSLAAIGLFVAIAYWNDWNNGYIYLVKRTDLYSIQNLLNRLMQNINALTQNASQVGNVNQGLSEIPSVSVRMAMATLGILPIVVIYPFIQKNFVKGITLGGVKG